MIKLTSDDLDTCYEDSTFSLEKVPFLLGKVGRGIFEFFCEKSCGPPTSQIGLMNGPSQIPKQKHLTLPPPSPRQK